MMNITQPLQLSSVHSTNAFFNLRFLLSEALCTVPCHRRSANQTGFTVGLRWHKVRRSVYFTSNSLQVDHVVSGVPETGLFTLGCAHLHILSFTLNQNGATNSYPYHVQLAKDPLCCVGEDSQSHAYQCNYVQTLAVAKNTGLAFRCRCRYRRSACVDCCRRRRRGHGLTLSLKMSREIAFGMGRGNSEPLLVGHVGSSPSNGAAGSEDGHG